MCRRVYGQARKGWGALLLLVVAGAACILFVGEAKRPELSAASQAALRRPTGYPQLVSVEPLPVADGQMCEWVPASASTTLVAALRQTQSTGRPTGQSSGLNRVAIDVERAHVADQRPARLRVHPVGRTSQTAVAVAQKGSSRRTGAQELQRCNASVSTRYCHCAACSNKINPTSD